ATPLLACLAAAIGPTHRIELKPSWHEYAVIWSLIVGKSGTQKSPALDAAVRFLQEIDKAKARQFRAAIADYIENHKQWTKDHKAWKAGGGAGAEPEEPQRPKRPRHICSDTTIEAAAQLLDENPRGLLLFRDEMSGWIGSFGRYSGAGSADASGWLELFGCRPLTIDRKTGDRPTIWVERPFLCVTGSIQPSTLKRSLREEHLENGLAARLLIAFPPVRERKWSSHSASQEAIDAARNVFRRLVALGPAADAPASMEPRDLVLSRRARELWVSFFDAHARQSAALGEAEAAAWSKLEAYTARLALVINLVRFVSDEPGVTQHSIDGDSMRMAVQLAKWYGEEAIRVYAMLHESKAESERRDLIDVIRRHGGRITANDLRIASRRFKSNEQSNAFLDSLAKSGQGRWTKQSTTPRGGRPTRVFELNSPPTETETQPPRRRKKDSGNGKRSRSFKERWKHCIEINRAEGWIPKVGHP
ncbi:MAG: YfjI family protein, partial [Pseudomonadota bacterium]